MVWSIHGLKDTKGSVAKAEP